jgi:oligoendopeptidase F
MGMELLAQPYLVKRHGGFYSPADANRALAENLDLNLQFWPYMAMVDEFQHWAYEHPREGANPQALDAKWAQLEARFRPHIDWSGCEEVMMTGWQRKDHIHQAPFYYMEYGLALLGAAQVWRNALSDPQQALERYRSALALGGTATLPQLYRTAGARFSLDAGTLRQAVEMMETRLIEIESNY